MLSAGGILTRKLVCAGGGAVPSQWTELPLRYQAIKSKNDKKKTIKKKREKRKMKLKAGALRK